MQVPFRRFVMYATVAALPLMMAAPLHSAWAQSYGAWTPPDAAPGSAQNKSVDALIKDLNALIADAEKSRAANPVFLSDLKKLAARYGSASSERVVFDDFADGDFQRNPAWSVTSGDYFIEQGYGLRARGVEAAAAAAPQKVSKEQLALSILGAVLQGANKDSAGAAAPAAPAAVAKPSMIETRARISNAFSATVELSSWKADGTFEVAMNQGLGGAGYRLIYTPGPSAQLELVRVTSRGRTVIDAKAMAALEDQKIHALNWTRAADGAMTVALDGKAVLSARDTSFRDPFDALAFSSQGSDIIVKSVTVMGTR